MNQVPESALLVAASGTDVHFTGSPFYAQFGPPAKHPAPPDQLRNWLRALHAQQETKIDILRYPSSVKDLLRKEFSRILQAVETKPDDYFDLGRHAVRSDFRLLAFGRIPVGPEHLEVTGVPRNHLYRRGWRQALRFARLVWQSGGVRPYYELHLSHSIHPKTFLLAYNAQSQEAMLRRVAECLVLHPEVRGVFAGTWWYDPELSLHSPYLTFLREGWVSRGATLLYAGRSPSVTELATANSPARQALVAEGVYQPARYTVMWPRTAILQWAESDQ